MKALVYHGPGNKSWETVPDPSPAEPTEAGKHNALKVVIRR